MTIRARFFTLSTFEFFDLLELLLEEVLVNSPSEHC